MQTKIIETIAPTEEPRAYSVADFCKAHGISTSTFYRLQTAGRGPRTMMVLSSVRVSAEAAAEWRRACEETAMTTINKKPDRLKGRRRPSAA